jgi:hypothetical protein
LLAGQCGELAGVAAEVLAFPLDQREHLEQAVVDRAAEPISLGGGRFPPDLLGVRALGAAGGQRPGEAEAANGQAGDQEQEGGRDHVVLRRRAELVGYLDGLEAGGRRAGSLTSSLVPTPLTCSLLSSPSWRDIDLLRLKPGKRDLTWLTFADKRVARRVDLLVLGFS